MVTTAENATHVSVLLNEVIEALVSKDNKEVQNPWFLDGTLGLAGHSSTLLKTFSEFGIRAELCGLDRDPQALERAEQNLLNFKEQVHLFESDYASYEHVLPSINSPLFNGVLLDLGVSSLQLDVAERGFSYHKDGPLNMRMDMGSLMLPESAPNTQSAKTFVNKADFDTLKRVITELGEDPQAGRIARAIVDARQQKSIESTKELADIIYHAYPAKWRANARNHPATRTFQAVRMHINDELGQLSRFLDGILDHVADNGVIAIISFHSLEDRLVKQKFKEWATDCICPAHIPTCVCKHYKQAEVLTKKPILPSKEEALHNPRASSAKLRIARKLPNTKKTLQGNTDE